MTDSADQVIAKDNFANFKVTNYSKLSEDEAFERFAMTLSLKGYGVGPAEIERGLVGARDDGGIDGFSIFLNGQETVESDSVRISNKKNALSGLQTGLSLDVVLVQAKKETSWDTNVFPKIESALKVILDPAATAAELRAFPLNEDVVEKALTLKKLRSKLSMLVPVMKVTVQYITYAKQIDLDSYAETKRAQLENWLGSKLPTGSTSIVEFVGDAEIVTRLRISDNFTSKLIFAKAPVRVVNALVGLVKIGDYVTFLRKPNSTVLREELFAVNVRDYAGSNIRVNSAIAKTLEHDSATEFWWMNNGITIIADAASDPIELEWVATNPLIVNGLQTSNVIHDQALLGRISHARLEEQVLVRLVIESDPEVRESIISGTNNQTTVASIQLHANEEKQLRIEEFLRPQKWYFERRRYQYRGITVPAGRIRTMTDVGQAVMAFRLLEPDTARARPTSLLGTAAGWSKVFDPIESEELYLKALNVTEAVDAYLRTAAAKTIADDRTNARHYLVSGYALRSSAVKTLADFAKVPTSELKAAPTTAQLTELQKVLYVEVNKLDDGKTPKDRIFKGAKLRPAYLQAILKLNAS